MANKAIYQRVALTETGDIIPGAEYSVTNENTGTEQKIYSDRAGNNEVNQPAFADANGVIQFYTDPGVTYRVEATGGVGTYTDRYVQALMMTESANDSELGRLMKVGDFGVGAQAILSTSDADILTVSGKYTVGSNWTGSPYAGTDGKNQGYLDHYVWTAEGYELQHFWNVNGLHLSKWRRKEAGDWGNWVDSYDTNNVVGAVSELNGLPTGAIIESGSNANGEYTKFADGTLLCWHRILTVTGVEYTWTFPAATNDSSEVEVSGTFISGTLTQFANIRMGVASTTATTLERDGVANARFISLTMRARWF